MRLTSAVAVAMLASTIHGSALGAQSDAPHVPAVEPGLAALVPPLPPPGSYIADVPGVVPAMVRTELNARIRALQDSGFGDVGMAVVPSVGGYTPAQLGVAIYRTWRIGRIDTLGSARRNLGVLLLLVPKELAPDQRGHCWITTGRGAEAVVTDAASAAICRERVVPKMRERDHGEALLAGLDGISERLHREETLAEGAGARPADESRSGGVRWWYLFAGFGVAGGAVAIALWWRRARPRRCPECGARMARLPEDADDAALGEGQRTEERLGSVDHDVWRCPEGHETIRPYRSWAATWAPCTACGFRTARTRRTVIRQATMSRSGLARDTRKCESCGHTSVENVTLPRVAVAASSGTSRSGGFGGGGGGGGGGGFGGSGATGGGGGGSSY